MMFSRKPKLDRFKPSNRSQERSAMIRPFLALFTFLVLTLGVAAGSYAAAAFRPAPELQIQHMTRTGRAL